MEKVVAEVRALGGDAPMKGDHGNSDLPPKNSHEALLIRCWAADQYSKQ